MVKGISRQVIVVRSPDPKLFEQAIFILREDAKDVTQEQLLKQARMAVREGAVERRKRKLYFYGPAWACGGALLTGLVWFLTALF